MEGYLYGILLSNLWFMTASISGSFLDTIIGLAWLVVTIILLDIDVKKKVAA